MTSADIIQHLEGMAAHHGARLLLAAEVGSRAFGTATAASDHDIVAYLSFPEELDDASLALPQVVTAYGTVVAFGVRKAMKGIGDCNLRMSLPVLVAPDAILFGHGLATEMRELFDLCFDPSRLALQFVSSAKAAHETACARDGSAKLWLNVIHPALCASLVLSTSRMPPLDALALARESGSKDAVEIVGDLLAAKASGPGGPVSGTIARRIEGFLERAIAASRSAAPPQSAHPRKSAALTREILARIRRQESLATDLERYAKGLVIGEMGEALAVLGNGERFGLDTPSGHAATNPSERSRLVEELGDVLAAIEWATRAGLVDRAALEERKTRKLAKLTDPTMRDNLGRPLAPALPDRA